MILTARLAACGRFDRRFEFSIDPLNIPPQEVELPSMFFISVWWVCCAKGGSRARSAADATLRSMVRAMRGNVVR